MSFLIEVMRVWMEERSQISRLYIKPIQVYMGYPDEDTEMYEKFNRMERELFDSREARIRQDTKEKIELLREIYKEDPNSSSFVDKGV